MALAFALVSMFSVAAGLAPVQAQELEALERIPIPGREGSKPRNVVFILTDDHRYDAMGFMGHPFLKTPHLDAIAANGVHVKNAFVTTSLCSPSRASILTGLYTHKHRVIDNNRAVPSGTIFFPQYLQAAGYNTAFFGKWHMGSDADDPRPGFDHWVSFRGQGVYEPTKGYTLNINGERVPLKGYVTDELTQYAVEWMQQQSEAEKPFFVYLSHKAVHSNFTPASRHEGRYANEHVSYPDLSLITAENNTPRWVRDQRNSWHGIEFAYHSDKSLDFLYKRYCETMLAVDDSVGRVVQQLKNMGIHDETLVIYMGDNGFMWGEHGLIDKRVAYEESMRVPMLMQCPELFKGGTVLEEVVGNIDIGPTVLHAAGIKTPDHMDGESFIELAQGKDVPWRKNFLYVYYWEKNFPQTPTQFALRGNRYKYITYYGIWDTDELYDLQADPHETHNLIKSKEYQKIAKEMESELYQMLEEAGGMEIPLNQPRGGSANIRWSHVDEAKASPFPKSMIVDEPKNQNAN